MSAFLDHAKSFLGWASDPCQSETEALIEVVVNNYSPKIRLARNYKARLKAPVEIAADHIGKLVDQIPGPIDITDPDRLNKHLIRPFFADWEEYQKAMREDAALKAFLKSNHSETFYTLLTMQSQPKIFYGSQMQGEICVKNIAQKAMNLSDHRFRVPSPSAEQAFDRFKQGLLQNLTRQALEVILAKKAQIAELEHMQEELSVKVDIFALERRKMHICEEDERACQATQELLDQIEAELRSGKLTPEYYLNHICEFLCRSEQHLSAKPLGMKLDRMNILIADRADGGPDQIQAMDFRLDGEQSRLAVLLKCQGNVLIA